MFGSKKILGSKLFRGQKSFGVKKVLGSKKIWSQKNLHGDPICSVQLHVGFRNLNVQLHADPQISMCNVQLHAGNHNFQHAQRASINKKISACK